MEPMDERSSAGGSAGDFDLNIEKVLDGWEITHAIRELIANALDEAALSGTLEPVIERVGSGKWKIRDFGRGLRHVHLTQNENPEKREHEGAVIGRFGVGLKDALAVLDRRHVRVVIRSRHGDISLVHRTKAGFSDVTTLHARVTLPSDPALQGTEVCLSGVSDSDIETAKGYFLKFSNETVLEKTRYGEIIQRPKSRAPRVYVNGLAVAEEDNFAFSYNVTVLTKAMRKALNRERTNVGRTAYGERVKAMLLAAESEGVARELVKDVSALTEGNSHDEVRTWTDVGLRACQILNTRGRVVFVTAQQLLDEKDMVDRARKEGREVVTLPQTVASKLDTVADLDGRPLQSLRQFAADWSASVELKFVGEEDLTDQERKVFRLWRVIAETGGGLPCGFRELKISETMRPSALEGMSPAGLWEPGTGLVVIHRRELRKLEAFAGTLLHELAHARSGFTDVTREFELTLTELIGQIVAAGLRRRPA
jgi:hypothetical protein